MTAPAVSTWLRRGLVCVVVCLLEGVPAAQSGQTQGRVHLVDFILIGADGKPVTDLRANEISVKIGGAVGSVRSLRTLPASSDRGTKASRTQSLAFVDPETEAFERNFLLAVDDESLPSGSEQSTREAIAAFLRDLGPRDRVGLATIPVNGHPVPLTTEHWRVSQALRQFVGRGSRQENVTDAACRSRRGLLALTELFQSEARSDGPLVLVLFSASLLDDDNEVQLTLGTSVGCDLQSSEFKSVGVEAARARAYVYIVQPETFDLSQWRMNPRAGLEHLAGVTGGRILRLSGRGGDRLDRVDIEMSTVYVASVAIPSPGRPGAVYDLNIKTSRRGATVRARPQVSLSGR